MNTHSALATPDCTHHKLLSIDSDLSQVQLAADAVRNISDSLTFETVDSNKIELALVESVNNCIEHSYGYKPGYTIDIEYKLSDQELEVTVIDDGPASTLLSEKLNKNAVFNPEDTNFDVDSLPVSGWGIMLINSLCDDVSYMRNNERNMLTLSFVLSSNK